MWCAWGRGRLSITPNQGNRRLADGRENSTYDIPLGPLCQQRHTQPVVGDRMTDGDSYALTLMPLADRTCGWCGAGVYAQSQGSRYIFVQKELVRQNAHIKHVYKPTLGEIDMRVRTNCGAEFDLGEAVSFPDGGENQC